ncbi:MAG: carbohydrate-binding domain-containing protein [Prevotella sp.]|nr:carbohydrate-binding domain-containing protein [Prevotella sp.]
MKRLFFIITAFMATLAVNAVDDNTVEIFYNGSSATVTVANNIRSYITDQSNGSHVKLVQSSSVNDKVGEITYNLSGSSTDGEFRLEGSYKTTIELSGLTLTNPNGPALNIQDGKRVAVSAKKGTTNTLTDGTNYTDDLNGCLHCKGHTEFQGKGTLNIVGNYKHAIYSKEYVEIKNLTLNITAAKKDGIHCKEYFLIKGGTINISGVGDDGIQVELKGDSPTAATADHEDEDTGNFYMEDGELTISNYGSKAIKADGSVSISGGTQNYDKSDVVEHATGISSIVVDDLGGSNTVYDLNGRQMPVGKSLNKGIYIVRQGDKIKKTIVR